MDLIFDAEKVKTAAREFVWPAFGRDPSFFNSPGSILASGEGAYVTDVDGNRYIDASGCNFAATLGYNHPYVTEAMIRQTGALVQNASGSPPSVAQVQLAEKIASLTPGSLKYTLFSCNGTDANETAIKVARAYYKLQGKPTKYKVIGKERNYHGMGLGTLAAGGIIHRRKQVEPLPGGFIQISTPYCYRCKYPETHPACGERYADELRQAIEREDPSTVACFIGEQTVGGGGVIPPAPDYMERIRQICDEYDILLIVDEVITGFGRTGTWFECEQYSIVPDIIAMAKGITAGHAPLSATHVKEEIAQAFFGDQDRFFQHGYTYGGMAVSCAAGLAAIEFMEETGLLSQVPQKSASMMQGLEQIKERSSIIGDIRGNGMLFGVELVMDRGTKRVWDTPKRHSIAGTIVAAGRKHGVLFYPAPGLGTMIIPLSPPLTVEDREMDHILTALEAAVREVESSLA